MTNRPLTARSSKNTTQSRFTGVGGDVLEHVVKGGGQPQHWGEVSGNFSSTNASVGGSASAGSVEDALDTGCVLSWEADGENTGSDFVDALGFVGVVNHLVTPTAVTRQDVRGLEGNP